jgi:hypothetical protein
MFMRWLPFTLLKRVQMKELAYKLLHSPLASDRHAS